MDWNKTIDGWHHKNLVITHSAWVGIMLTQAQERNFMERLTFQEQVKFYLQWCKDNGLEPKEFKNLQAYFAEIRLSTQA